MVAYSERPWTTRVEAYDMPTIIAAYAELARVESAELVRARRLEERARDRRLAREQRKRATRIARSA